MHNETKIGKHELTEWIEKLLNRKNFDFKSLKDGDVYLQLFEYIWPNVMKKYKGCIHINPTNEVNKRKNWNIIGNVLNSVKIDKSFINRDEIAVDNFKECYQSLIILYFLYSLVKHHECDFILAYSIDQKLTDFMSSEEPLTCLVKAGSVQLPENFFEKISNSSANLNNLVKINEKDKINSKNNLSINDNSSEFINFKEKSNNIDKSDYDDDYNFEKYINNYHHNEYNNLNKEEDNIDDLEENLNLNTKFVTLENLGNNYSLNSLKKFDLNYMKSSKNKENNYTKLNNFNNKYYSNNDNDNNKSNNNNNYNNSNNNSNNKANNNSNNNSYNNNNNNRNNSLCEININNRLVDECNLNRSNDDNFAFNDNCELNLRKKNASYNLNNVSSCNNGSFFNYFNTKREEYDNYQNKTNENNKKNASVPNLNLFKFPNVKDSTSNDKNNFFLNFKKGKRDASSQTENDSILNNILNDESTMNLEIIWNDENKKIKGDSFIFFLKTQIKMFKKELDTKREELELVQKINKKTINDIKTSYSSELKKLKEKYEAEIFYLKQQHLENIVIVRKNFESKLNHIEEDLLLDLDVLNSENKNMSSSNEYKKVSYIDNNIENNNYEIKENGYYDINTINDNLQSDKKFITHDNKTVSVDSTIKENYNNDISKKNDFLNFNYNEEEDIYKNKKQEKSVEEDVNQKKTITHNNNFYMNNNIEYSIKKLKYLLNEKNKEHILNNECIKNEILHLRSMLNKTILEKEKIYNYYKDNNEIFNEILEFFEKNINKKNINDNLSKDFYLEKIKNSIYTIIRNKKKEHMSDEEITKYLDESSLISLIVYMGSLLHLERIKSEVIKIQKERNIFISNYVKNENKTECLLNKKNNIAKFEDEDNEENIKILSNEIPSSEIENFEKAMELDDKIKILEHKNKKLLSINEYYKKKLEHVEIWKSTLENFKKKCESFSNKNKEEQLENKNYNFINMKEGEVSKNLVESPFIGFPQFYLTSFEEETEREAQLMYLLKKLGRCDKEQDLNIFDDSSLNYSNNEKLFFSKKSKICSIYNQNYISDKEKIKNNQENNKLSLINQNEFLVILKKKLTYIFWQMLGDIYKYRNIIHEACNYIHNLNSMINNFILKNEKSQKEAKESFDLSCRDKENFYLSEKYRLRKIIGIAKLNMDIYKEQYVELKEECEKEKKNLIILTNACYENENSKYKYTIQKFKEVDKNLKIYKAREKKWNKLVKLLTVELRNSSKNNQEEIKNTWLEIIATKQNGSEKFKILKDEKLQKNNDDYSDLAENSNNFVTIIDNFNEQNNYSNSIIESNRNKGKDIVGKNLSSSKIVPNKYYCNYKKKINDKNQNPDKSITLNKGVINFKQGKNNLNSSFTNNDLNNSKEVVKDIENNNEVNFYKNDFNACLDNIENNDILYFCSSEMDSLITEKDEIPFDFSVEENKEINSNNILKYTNKDSIKITNFNKENINNNDIMSNKNWFSLLSQMAKESCTIFQNLLNLKEDELNEKKRKITDLEKELRELREENMNQINKYKCLEEQKEYLTNKLNSLNENVDHLNSQIFLLNKDKIYLESRHLTKQQELSIIIKNYKNVIDSIRKHVKKYSSILYLLDNLPEEDEKIILDLANIDEKNNSLNFSLDLDKNLELKKKEIINDDDVRIKINAKDSQVITNFSKLRISKLNDENKYISDLYINDLIKDIKCDNFR